MATGQDVDKSLVFLDVHSLTQVSKSLEASRQTGAECPPRGLTDTHKRGIRLEPSR